MPDLIEQMTDTHTTIDHGVIKTWIVKRGGVPAHVTETADADTQVGILRVDFKGAGDVGEGEENLMGISWESFFEKFEEENLAFIYQQATEDGGISRFYKFIDRADVDLD